ncbi:DUF6153 family protein [Microbacterium sp. LRZ72]|uniref:DUF6153 family protein n=1 Tax=Microbacterium sp. LRZ72 TaxID=2942481 RepID=UPI0029A87800|nr:DUF6153 family protein [Microbacterium sp. LRZ72]MDX2377712.1 DUF6153 family protein [Microbacterium sp. LRZ72]
MRVMRLRDALTFRKTLISPFLLAVLGIAMIVVGLLSMHGMGEAAHHSAPVAPSSYDVAESHQSQPLNPVEQQESAGDCESGCPSGEVMAMVGCVLALLVGAILVGIRPSATWIHRRHGVGAPAGNKRGTLAPSCPPDLTVLSISRT